MTQTMSDTGGHMRNTRVSWFGGKAYIVTNYFLASDL